MERTTKQTFSFAVRNGTGSLKDEESQFFSLSLLFSTTPAESNLFEKETEMYRRENWEKETGGKRVNKILLVNKILDTHTYTYAHTIIYPDTAWGPYLFSSHCYTHTLI